jgi:hypothetical protein
MEENNRIITPLQTVIITLLVKDDKKFIFSITSLKCPKLMDVGKENGSLKISPFDLKELTIIKKNGKAKIIKTIINTT